MKKTLLYLLLLMGLTVTSCKKDPNDPDNPDNPCYGVTCVNGGYCSNGSCVCPEGYTGSNCSQQQTPSKITIYKIDLLSYAPTDNGSGWDLTTPPDIYMGFEYYGGTAIAVSGTAWDTNASGLTWNCNIQLTAVTNQYQVTVYDEDTTIPDVMGGVAFTLYNSSNGFPSTKTFTYGNTSVKVYMNYTW